MKTWDGRHPIDRIEVRIVYFVPRDRAPLPDWKDRVAYFANRISKFHAREYGDQSRLTTRIEPEPLRSARTTSQLRSGDADFIFFQTLQEADERLSFARPKPDAFPILLVLSDINWRPLDDFYRLSRQSGQVAFEGNLRDGRHYPGAASGGARATYLPDRGVGWGLVSADGWRVPYTGSDCVVYHEGVGHTVGLPHPEPANGSVMSVAQYQGWLSESWLDDDQKRRLGWQPPEAAFDRQRDLYSRFRALAEPAIPRPGEVAALRMEWPAEAQIKSLRVRMQTDLFGPWIDVPVDLQGMPPTEVRLGLFDRPTPVSYRVDAELATGEAAELWGYLQVRNAHDESVIPVVPLPELMTNDSFAPALPDSVNLLERIRPERDAVTGTWTNEAGSLLSPKGFGMRLEIPYAPPEEYRLIAIVEPLDTPNGLILGQRVGESRFLVLLNFQVEGATRSALEKIDGKDVRRNPTGIAGTVFRQGQPSQVICSVRKEHVVVSVDGRTVIDWQGTPSQLSLSNYWKTPREDALFLGAYDCRYRISRLTLEPLSTGGRDLAPPETKPIE